MHLNPAVKLATMYPQHVAMCGSSLEELILLVGLERSSDSTFIAIEVVD